MFRTKTVPAQASCEGPKDCGVFLPLVHPSHSQTKKRKKMLRLMCTGKKVQARQSVLPTRGCCAVSKHSANCITADWSRRTFLRGRTPANWGARMSPPLVWGWFTLYIPCGTCSPFAGTTHCARHIRLTRERFSSTSTSRAGASNRQGPPCLWQAARAAGNNVLARFWFCVFSVCSKLKKKKNYARAAAAGDCAAVAAGIGKKRRRGHFVEGDVTDSRAYNSHTRSFSRVANGVATS